MLCYMSDINLIVWFSQSLRSGRKNQETPRQPGSKTCIDPERREGMRRRGGGGEEEEEGERGREEKRERKGERM